MCLYFHPSLSLMELNIARVSTEVHRVLEVILHRCRPIIVIIQLVLRIVVLANCLCTKCQVVVTNVANRHMKVKWVSIVVARWELSLTSSFLVFFRDVFADILASCVSGAGCDIVASDSLSFLMGLLKVHVHWTVMVVSVLHTQVMVVVSCHCMHWCLMDEVAELGIVLHKWMVMSQFVKMPGA